MVSPNGLPVLHARTMLDTGDQLDMLQVLTLKVLPGGGSISMLPVSVLGSYTALVAGVARDR